VDVKAENNFKAKSTATVFCRFFSRYGLIYEKKAELVQLPGKEVRKMIAR